MLLNKELNTYGIGSGQYIFLFSIMKKEGLTQKDLSRINHVDKATTAKALKKLEANGFIEILPNQDDKRYKNIYLSQKGKELRPVFRKILGEISNLCLDGISDSDYAVVTKSLGKIFDNLEGVLDKY